MIAVKDGRARLTKFLAKVSLQRACRVARMAGDLDLVLTTDAARLLPFDGQWRQL
jgi:hypothetical protein